MDLLGEVLLPGFMHSNSVRLLPFDLSELYDLYNAMTVYELCHDTFKELIIDSLKLFLPV